RVFSIIQPGTGTASHEVRLGITGWAQVNGRNAVSEEDKFKIDVWYVEQLSFSLDVKILLMTVQKVFKSEGISAEDQATAERFKVQRYEENCSYWGRRCLVGKLKCSLSSLIPKENSLKCMVFMMTGTMTMQ